MRVITPQSLATLSLKPAIRWAKKQALQSKLRTLQQAADYFKWQQDNGHAGLADTHKQIALVESDIRNLK